MTSTTPSIVPATQADFDAHRISPPSLDVHEAARRDVLLRAFDTFAKANGLKAAHLTFDDDQLRYVHRDGQTWMHVTCSQWTKLEGQP